MPQDQPQKIESERDLERNIAGWVVLFGMSAFALYFIVFALVKGLKPGGPDAWAEFGDYFGGVVNPVVGILTAILVVRTLKVTRDEANNTRVEMAKQTSLLGIQAESNKREQQLLERQKRLDGLLNAWFYYIDRNVVPAADFGSWIGAQSSPTLRGFFADSITMPWVAKIAQKPNWPNLQRDLFSYMEEPVRLLREFATYISDYDEVAGNKVLTDFYRQRINYAVRTLGALGYLDSTTRDALFIPMVHDVFLVN